ncbi:hypothetical protein NS506_06900 [Nocardia seriolae]|uniref:Secreted protein n=1 Tax=Nocardia seriolae TaxID=37332 RepID=A0ABC8B331_9NOCA|nr:hypothetical protein NS506_06900 [Nocardia seriolae]
MRIPIEHARRAREKIAATSTIILAAVAAILFAVNAGTATGETPEERCQRETAAYNSAWESTWRASHPGDSGPPPPPPVPYVCHDPGTPTTTTPPVTAPGLAPTQAPGGGVPGQAGKAPGQLPQGNGTDIVAGPTNDAPPAGIPTPTVVRVPTSAEPKDINGPGESAGCGVDWHGPPCAVLEDCPPGYALVADSERGQVCFQVEVVNPSFADPAQVSDGVTTGNLPVEYNKTVTDTATDTVSGSVTQTDGSTQTVGTAARSGDDRDAQFLTAAPGSAVENVLLQQREEALHIASRGRCAECSRPPRRGGRPRC